MELPKDDDAISPAEPVRMEPMPEPVIQPMQDPVPVMQEPLQAEPTPMEPMIIEQNTQLKAYKYRFLILIIYGLYSGANLYQINQFTIIENVVHKYYQTTTLVVGLSQLMFMFVLIIFIIPVVRIVERFDLRVAGLICSGVTFAGAMLKVYATEPTESAFNLILFAQTVCGFAQVFTIMLPAKLVAVWFPAKEQNRACAAALFGGEIGMLLGTIVPILYVEGKTTKEEIQRGLHNMLSSNAVFCGLVFILVLLFFKSKPPTPPSLQQVERGDHRTHFYTAFFELSVNQDFLTLTVIYGLACGMWSVFGIIENIIYLHYFPNSLIDLTYITAITTISGGLIGNYLFGYILDKTLKYKLFTIINFVCITVSYGIMTFCLEENWYWASYFTIILFGFFCSSCVNISFQYLAEVSFPISEVVPIALLQIILCAVTILYTLGFNMLLAQKHFRTVHMITVATFCGMTAGTYFLSNELRRMLLQPPQ